VAPGLSQELSPHVKKVIAELIQFNESEVDGALFTIYELKADRELFSDVLTLNSQELVEALEYHRKLSNAIEVMIIANAKNDKILNEALAVAIFNSSIERLKHMAAMKFFGSFDLLKEGQLIDYLWSGEEMLSQILIAKSNQYPTALSNGSIILTPKEQAYFDEKVSEIHRKIYAERLLKKHYHGTGD
jgi:hypothetical protein